MQTVATIARSLKIDPKVARAKLRRAGKKAPAKPGKELNNVQVKKLKEFLKQ
jgi:hypothetical protein